MSIASALSHVFGIIKGIIIPGANPQVTDLTHSVQQHLADLYGKAATDLATRLHADTTGLTGPQKLFMIAEAIVATAVKDGIKADVTVLKAVAVDVAQAAYRQAEPKIGAGIIALAAAIGGGPIVQVAAQLVAPVVQGIADATLPKSAA